MCDIIVSIQVDGIHKLSINYLLRCKSAVLFWYWACTGVFFWIASPMWYM